MADDEKCRKFYSQILNKDKHPDYLKSLIGISDDTKSKLMSCISDFQDTLGREKEHYGGYVESKLVYRFLNPSPFLSEKIKEVGGPVLLYQMSHPNISEYPQIFYLFGDLHVMLSKCPGYGIADWIYDTIIDSPVFIDVYLESPYLYKDYDSSKMGKKTPNYIKDIYDRFKNCFDKESKIVCQTSRFHYTDMRRIFETKYQRYGYTQISKLKNPVLTEMIKLYVNAYFDYLLSEESVINKRIRKQIDNIENPVIKRVLEDCLQHCREKNRFDYISQGDIGRKLSEVVNYNSVQNYGDCLMDYYLMTRCFRTYKKGVKYFLPSYNNIIYAGGGHIRSYINILTKLGFVIDFEKVDFDAEAPGMEEKFAQSDGIIEWFQSIPNFQCLDISEMKQPMFHQRYTKED